MNFSNFTNSTPNSNRWLLSDELEGSVIATFLAVEFLLSLSANLFISIYTLLNAKKVLKKSSTILLFNLALSNLLVALFYVPFVIVASAAGEWIIGCTDEVREGFCQFTGYIFSYSISVSVYILAAISFDRFLFIVRPYLHQRWMTWKMTLGIVVFIWLLSIFLSLVPYAGIGEYDWSPSTGGCVPLWTGNRDYVIIYSAAATIPLGIIIITSAWTFIFTRWFLKKNLRRIKRTLTKQNLEIHKSIYTERIRNLFGVFGTLFFLNILSWSPFFIASFVGLVVGVENLPVQVFPTVFILYMLSNVTNPLVQAYFRKELLVCIKSCLGKVLCLSHFRTSSKHSKDTHITSSQHNDPRMTLRANRGDTTEVTSLESHDERGSRAESHEGRAESQVGLHNGEITSTLQVSITIENEDTST